MKKILFALAALLLAFPLAAQQFDYQLSGYTYAGIPDAGAVLHIQTVSFDGTNCTVTARIYPSLAIEELKGQYVTGQWIFPTTDTETVDTVWATLQGMSGLQTSDNAPISFVGPVPVTVVYPQPSAPAPDPVPAQ